MFENLSSSEWLLYISEWTYNNQQISNIRVTTKVAVHSLLADLPILQEYGAAVIYNLACKEVKTVVCISSCLIIQFLCAFVFDCITLKKLSLFIIYNARVRKLTICKNCCFCMILTVANVLGIDALQFLCVHSRKCSKTFG